MQEGTQRRAYGPWLAAGGVLVLDQLSKMAASTFQLPWEWGPVAFGIITKTQPFSFPQSEWLIDAGTPLVLGVLTAATFLLQQRLSPHIRYSLALLVAGGVSNLLDRLRFGSILDIIAVNTFALNIADVFIISGCCGVLVGLIFDKQPTTRSKDPKSVDK